MHLTAYSEDIKTALVCIVCQVDNLNWIEQEKKMLVQNCSVNQATVIGADFS